MKFSSEASMLASRQQQWHGGSRSAQTRDLLSVSHDTVKGCKLLYSVSMVCGRRGDGEECKAYPGVSAR